MIDDYVVEEYADHVLATYKNSRRQRLVQEEWTRPAGRARAAPDRQKKPDHWRAA